MALVFALLIFLINYSHQAIKKDFAGPYDLIVHHFEECEDQGTQLLTFKNIKARKFNRTTTVHSVTIFLNTTVSDEDEVHIKCAMWGNGGWIENFFDMRIKDPFTFAAKNSATLMKPIYDMAGIEKPPFLPGVYQLDNYVFKPDGLKVPALPYNSYKARAYILNNGTIFGCFGALVDVKPKIKNVG